MRLPSRAWFVRVLLGLACLASAAGCGRTDLEDELGLDVVDGGQDAPPDVTTDTGFDVVTPPFDVSVDVIFPDDVFFDSSFDVPTPPVDAPFDTIFPVDAPGNDTGTCGNGHCDDGETCESCPEDCGFCTTCGDGTCESTESCSSCPIDCGACATCGDGFCDDGETCTTCPQDCGVCPFCGDGTCGSNENCQNCPADCGMCMGCGDGHCDGTETCISCPQDCGSCAFCGNGVCQASEGETCNTCPEDCGQCAIAATCEQILTCAFGCFTGGIGGFDLSCLTGCDANACTQAQGFANDATDCIIDQLLMGSCGFGGGMGQLLTCLEGQCSAPIAACLGSAPCPGNN